MSEIFQDPKTLSKRARIEAQGIFEDERKPVTYIPIRNSYFLKIDLLVILIDSSNCSNQSTTKHKKSKPTA